MVFYLSFIIMYCRLYNEAVELYPFLGDLIISIAEIWIGH